MCLKSSKPQPLHIPRMRSASYYKRYTSKIQTHLRIFNLTRRRRLLREEENEMEKRNLKLFVENLNIIRENEALKKKALLLFKENNALFALLHPKLSHVSTSSLN